ncbi:MAG: hypothetical protein J5I50_09675 [Chitinophagaceae bacterium]|nr:hypothetical protein [Chitinophagaceae bacterium]
MEPKQNEPTELRPEGGRILDAPMVQIDLNKFTEILKDEKTWKTSDRNAITVFKTKGMRIVLIALHKDAVITEHKAEDGVINVQVLEGKIRFDSEAGSAALDTGNVATLHKGLKHSVTALEKSVFLLTIGG